MFFRVPDWRPSGCSIFTGGIQPGERKEGGGGVGNMEVVTPLLRNDIQNPSELIADEVLREESATYSPRLRSQPITKSGKTIFMVNNKLGIYNIRNTPTFMASTRADQEFEDVE